MYGSSRFNLLVVALITLVSFVTARTIITSQTCATRYCGYPVGKVYKVTKTVHKSTRYTRVRWKTVSKPKYTRTVTGTTTLTRQRWSTILTVTIESTVWIGTTTHTRKFTVTTPSSTLTIPASTTTISSTTTIPAPAGFVGVNDDPDNKAAQEVPRRLKHRDSEPESNDVDDLDRRDAAPEPEPEPEPVAKGKYVTAVTCTKTLITKTGTSDLWKTTTKSTGTTTKTLFLSTQTFWPDIKTVTKKGAKTVRLTTSKYKVAFASSTSTVTEGVATKYLSTVTSRLPVETYHASCGARNQGPRPHLREGMGWAAIEAGPDPSLDGIIDIWSNGTAYDCCVACHTYKDAGVCVGTVWRSTIWGGDPGCWDAPDCNWEPFEPEFRSKCQLIIAEPGNCRRRGFNFYSMSAEPEAAVSNGLGCRRYKFGIWYP